MLGLDVLMRIVTPLEEIRAKVFNSSQLHSVFQTHAFYLVAMAAASKEVHLAFFGPVN